MTEADRDGAVAVLRTAVRVDVDAIPDGAPLIRVRAYSLMGGTDVRTKTDKPRRRKR